ncbi:Tex family protein [Anaeromicrobium sediminis]|uniref:RNA-binding transcriptional accessory protein n=1 Tax=Anaeromicrobium sediminis TaxID=1478221 RepID=A0A267MIE3_9FIRM|nr:Tex family protein [Anaeromicrobium sediminis]PAB59351.1 RNA-binding transcriptional accessory protein [Anaeromicrobium sediminis]
MIIDILSKEFNISRKQIESTINLIDEGCTVPFIARYRKEVTGGLSDVILRELNDRLTYLRNLEKRKEEVIRIIEEQGKLTEELKDKILKAKVLQKVEDLYRPYQQKRRTRATIAKEKGLEPFALDILKGIMDDLESEAKKYIDEEKEVGTVEDAIKGAMDIIAETISDTATYREKIRNLNVQKGSIQSTGLETEEDNVYEMYKEYVEKVKTIPNHRILAINRGEKEKALKVKIISPDEEIIELLEKSVVTNANKKHENILKEVIGDAYKRLISPSIEREIRNMLTERAEDEAIKVFAKNTKPLLMVPPVKNVRVLAIDPSYRTGCKISVLDDTGKLLEYTTIYPNAPQNEVEKSKKVLKELIDKYDIDVIPIGNGTASRETEMLVADMLSEIDKTVYYTIVSEAGASVYSASKLAAEEYPDVNVSIRGAISIGRRLQDPLAELVKIDPKSIGVGQYQHDLNQSKLGDALTGVVEDCVNTVGVDLNIATPALLEYVSGINKSIAKNIVAYREENGKFTDRKEIKKVKRLGNKAFEQCAGFLRISDGKNSLDNTAVHPESYKVVLKLLSDLSYTNEDIKNGHMSDIEDRIKEKYGDIKTIADELEIGVPTLVDIIGELKKPGRDIREEMPKPVFRSDVLKMEDLKVDMELTGTVRNVVDFGAFVDIGVKQDGLVHISQLSDKFVKNPMDIVAVGDAVKVKIIDIDLKKGRISLTMKGIK